MNVFQTLLFGDNLFDNFKNKLFRYQNRLSYQTRRFEEPLFNVH